MHSRHPSWGNKNKNKYNEPERQETGSRTASARPKTEQSTKPAVLRSTSSSQTPIIILQQRRRATQQEKSTNKKYTNYQTIIDPSHQWIIHCLQGSQNSPLMTENWATEGIICTESRVKSRELADDLGPPKLLEEQATKWWNIQAPLQQKRPSGESRNILNPKFHYFCPLPALQNMIDLSDFKAYRLKSMMIFKL